jgi:DNA transposition AAA+ family ATPase
MMTKEFKQRIAEAMAEARKNFSGSDAKFSTSLGISSSQYNRVKNGEIERVLGEASWITIARKLGVSLREETPWRTAETPVYQYISAQLEMCQKGSDSAMICDLSDIGKTYTARQYVKTHKNAIYIDCSQVKTKQKLIKQIAKEFGVGTTGKYAEIYEDLVFYLKTLSTPLIILDEAGDLQYDAFLEIKALYNATEKCCGYYMMGADGLQEKMTRAINNRKVGYTELFSRFGKRYSKAIPEGDNGKKVLQATALMIIKANSGNEANINKIYTGTLGEDGLPSLRRIYKELAKQEVL